MKTMMVDMDDVITGGNFFKLICKFLGKDIDINDVKGYYLQELLEDRAEEFWESVRDVNFYEESPLKMDCYEVLERLSKRFDIYIVTSYLWKDTIDISGNTLRDKYYYLRDKLPFIAPENYIFTTNKNIINFDIRIDDKMNNLSGSETKLLFNAWHNQEISEEDLKASGVIRVNNWLDIERVINEIYPI